MAPRLVCATFAWDDQVRLYGGDEQGRQDAMQVVRNILTQAAEGTTIVVGQNIPYDLGVVVSEDPSLLPLVFQGYDRGCIRDSMTRQMLIDNARGDLKYIEDEAGDLRPNDFSLQNLVKRHLKKWIQKGADSWQKRYNELDGVPVEDWPNDAKVYPMKDASYTLQVYNSQEAELGTGPDGEPAGIPGDLWIHQHAWALYLMTLWGLRTDIHAVEKLSDSLDHDLAELRQALIQAGLVRTNGVRDMAVIRDRITQAYTGLGLKVQLTDGGKTGNKQVSTERDVLMNSEDASLEALSEFVRLGKVKTTYVPALRLGARYPITPRYNACLETYRSSCSKPNVQNPPRKGGVRECFVPRGPCSTVPNGWRFGSADYDTAELRSLAEVCYELFGFSFMGEALIADKDLHLDFAADELIRAPYDEVFEMYQAGDEHVENMRQLAKVADFGLPGGMSAKAFQSYARKGYGLTLTEGQSSALHSGFRRKWKEMDLYFPYCSRLCDGGDADQIQFVRSGMLRGKVRYTAVCNGFFQHLTAMGAKDACYAVAKECYLGVMPNGRPSPLAGCRPVLFLHDEIIIEIPYHSAEFGHLAVTRLAEVMKQAMERWITRVPVKCSPVLTRRWWKGAKAVQQDGMIVPVKPVKTPEGKTKWVEDVGEERIAA
jgi:DNA polymerase I-like protein with 3'-5' exonuclease and polymerase domains